MPYWDWAQPGDVESMFPRHALRNTSISQDFMEKAELKYNPLFKYVFFTPDPKKDDRSVEEKAAWKLITHVR
jgi:hypothetical protein